MVSNVKDVVRSELTPVSVAELVSVTDSRVPTAEVTGVAVCAGRGLRFVSVIVTDVGNSPFRKVCPGRDMDLDRSSESREPGRVSRLC